MKNKRNRMNDVLEKIKTSQYENNLYSLMLDEYQRNFTDVSDLPDFEKYSSLFELVELDDLYGMLKYRSDKRLFDKFKTRAESNKVFHISDENAVGLLGDAFIHKMPSPERINSIVNNKSYFASDSLSSDQRIDLFVELLYEKFSDKIKIDSDNRQLFYKKDQSVNLIDDYSEESFARFLRFPVKSTITVNESLKAVRELTHRLNEKSASSKNDVIQFNDCYLLEGKVKKGFYDLGFPRFTMKRPALKAVETMTPTVVVEEVDQLVMHLCNDDKDTYERFMDEFSVVFLNSKKYKSRYNLSPRIVGKDGENGKSTLQDLISRTFNVGSSTNCVSFALHKLDQRDTVYKVLNSLVAIDGDSSSKIISEDAASMFKSITSGDAVDNRALFKEAESTDARCLLIEFSNDFPKSSDKSSAYLRRLDLILCLYQLKNDLSSIGPNSKPAKFEITQEWFDRINSPEAEQYFFESLLIRSQRIERTGKIAPKSKHMLETLQRYAYSNNSALSFFHEVGIEKIVGYTVKEVKKTYEDWCDEHDLTVMKQKFIETMESEGLCKNSVSLDYLNPSSEMYESAIAGKTGISAWQYSNHEENEAYFSNLRSESNIKTLQDRKIQLIKDFVSSIGSTLENLRVSTVKDKFKIFSKDKGLFLKDKEFNQILQVKYNMTKKNISREKVSLIAGEKLEDDAKVFCCWVKETE